MGNKKAKEQERAATQYTQQASQNIAQIQVSPEQQAIGQQAYADYNRLRSGDVSNVWSIQNYLQRAAAARQAAERNPLLGAASLAMNIANPNLIAMNRDQLNRQAEEQNAQVVTGLAGQAEQDAVNRVFGASGANMQAAAMRAGGYRGLADFSWDRYKQYKQQGTFWSNLGKGLISGAGAFASAFFGGGK